MLIVTYMPWKNKEDANKYSNDYYHKNHEQCLKICRKSAHKRLKEVKDEIYKLLGGKCVNPFNLNHGDFLVDRRCLQIDHVNGGGCKEHKKTRNGFSYYLKVLNHIKSGGKDYQLLCANCNWIKVHVNKENTQPLYKTEYLI